MMKCKPLAAGLIACALVVAPLSSAFAEGRHGGYYYGWNPVVGLVGAVIPPTAHIVLVGHSMVLSSSLPLLPISHSSDGSSQGGAVVVHAAAMRSIKNIVVGVCVLDVVEGTVQNDCPSTYMDTHPGHGISFTHELYP